MNDPFRFMVAAIFLAASMLSPALTFADPDRAAQHYESASQAYQNGDYRKAADLLERAYAEDPDLVYQYNRILALEAQGDHSDALRVLEIYEEPMMRDENKRFTDIGSIKDRLQEAQARRARPEPADNPSDVERDTTDQGPAVGDREPKRGELDDDEPDPQVEAETRWLAWSLVGSGALSATAGVLFASGLLASAAVDNVQCVSDATGGADPVGPRESRDALQSCYPDEATYLSGLNAYTADQSSLATQQTLSIVFLSAGAVLATTGIVLLVIDSGDESSASLSPYVGHDGAGAVFEMRY